MSEVWRSAITVSSQKMFKVMFFIPSESFGVLPIYLLVTKSGLNKLDSCIHQKNFKKCLHCGLILNLFVFALEIK